MKKQLTAAALVLATVFAGSSALAQKREAVSVSVVDAKGVPVKVETLPKDVQENLKRVTKAAEQLQQHGNQRVKVTVGCSYPPLKCTITIQF